MRAIVPKIAIVAAQIGFVALMLGLWQLGANEDWIDSRKFSEPIEIWHRLRDMWNDDLLFHVGSTLRVLVLGYGLGLGVGVLFGTLAGLSPWFRSYVEPFVVVANSVPRAILVPFFITWLGFGTTPKVLTVFLVVVFYVIINITAAVQEIESDVVANARTLGASRSQLARDVYLPSLGLWILASARVTFGFAFQAAIVAEFFGALAGIGFLVVQSQAAFDVDGIYAALAVTMAIALVLDTALGVVERRVSRWMPT